MVSADIALDWLIEGNKDYMDAEKNHHGDISFNRRLHTHKHGQFPIAVIVTCSDSRVIPESIFMKGIGDLFVIRLAGNVMGDYALGSVEYAIEHLECKLVMVMGHTACGAISAAIDKNHTGYIGSITKEIKKAIGNEMNPTLATKLNVNNTIKKIMESEVVRKEINNGVKIVGSVYHTHSGRVELY